MQPGLREAWIWLAGLVEGGSPGSWELIPTGPRSERRRSGWNLRSVNSAITSSRGANWNSGSWLRMRTGRRTRLAPRP